MENLQGNDQLQQIAIDQFGFASRLYTYQITTSQSINWSNCSDKYSKWALMNNSELGYVKKSHKGWQDLLS